jgi:hypothetical protein
MRAVVHPVAQVLLGPDDVPFGVDEGLDRAPPQHVAVNALELLTEGERLVARRKIHNGAGEVLADWLNALAEDLGGHPRDRVSVSASIHAVAEVFLRPHDGAFDVDETRLRAATEHALILSLEPQTEVERLVSRWKGDVLRNVR